MTIGGMLRTFHFPAAGLAIKVCARSRPGRPDALSEYTPTTILAAPFVAST
jgi:hypothetical protein